MTGVELPEVDGRRSSAGLGREVVAAALETADPRAAAAARATQDWRSGYLPHFRTLVEVGLPSVPAALDVARAGLAALHDRMELDGRPLSAGLPLAGDARLELVEVKGEAERPEREVVVPYRGQLLRGDALRRQLDDWVRRAVVEPSCAEAVGRVLDNPDWLDLSDRTVVVLGAGAELGPLQALLRWGGDVVGVDLPRPALWERVLRGAREAGGRLRVPVRAGTSADQQGLAAVAGADLLTDLPALGALLSGLDGPLVLSNDVYADGATHLRVSAAVDALTVHLLQQRADLSLAFLATPTDVYAVPMEDVAEARRRYAGPSLLSAARLPLGALSLGRLMQPGHTQTRELAGEQVGLVDALVPQQGPNYVLAKRVQRWRAGVARADGVTVSLNVAPATRTRSVTRNRLLATAYSGAGRFGVEVFEPATSTVLMAALLVHDLRHDRADAHPARAEMQSAAHGGFWTQPYAVRSVLGLAVLMGVGRR